MNSPQTTIRVLEPITPALERVRTVLFRPFDPARWLVIGFCAWLAGLGQSGGGTGGGGHFGGDRHHDGREMLRDAWDYLQANLYWILPLVIGLVVIGILVWILFTWLSSRGQFMFLHCVGTNRAEVRVPWIQYCLHGNSLFRFRLVLGLIAFLVLAPTILGGIGFVLAMVAREQATLPGVLGGVAAFLGAVVFGVVFGVIAKFTRDFVVPVMALRTNRCRVAWREVLGLLTAHPGAFLLYLLVQVALAVVVGILIFGIVVLTCCLAGCLLVIPFLGTVLFLPILVFDRAYSLYYLAQYGPEYRVIQQESPPLQPVGLGV